MKHKILVVEDDHKLREFVGLYLKKDGYEMVEAVNGKEGINKFDGSISLVLLDIMMPENNGFEVAKHIRKTSQVPIIFLTALGSEDYHVEGYEVGGDDYITKPFKSKILMAKIKRFLSKIDTNEESDKGILYLDHGAHEIYLEGTALALAPREYDLLAYLMANDGIALTRDQLLEEVWGYDFESQGRVVDNHIKKLRKKLGDHDLIKTVKSVGYKIEVPK